MNEEGQDDMLYLVANELVPAVMTQPKKTTQKGGFFRSILNSR